MPSIYVFSSSDLTNIWAGVGARKWAVSQALAANAGTVTKAASLQIGALGLIYCSGTQEFTTPFIVSSQPQSGVTVTNIWPQPWELPFGIVPLGSPDKRLHKSMVASSMPSASAPGAQWNHILYVQPNFSFQPSHVTDADWAYLFGQLVY